MLAHLTAGQLDGRRQADDDFGGRVKMTLLFLAVSGPKFTMYMDLCGFQRRFPVISIKLHAGDIRSQSCH